MSVNSTCFYVKMVKDMLKTPVIDDEALAIMGLCIFALLRCRRVRCLTLPM
jgi:hypothetical protein